MFYLFHSPGEEGQPLSNLNDLRRALPSRIRIKRAAGGVAVPITSSTQESLHDAPSSPSTRLDLHIFSVLWLVNIVQLIRLKWKVLKQKPRQKQSKNKKKKQRGKKQWQPQHNVESFLQRILSVTKPFNTGQYMPAEFAVKLSYPIISCLFYSFLLTLKG